EVDPWTGLVIVSGSWRLHIAEHASIEWLEIEYLVAVTVFLNKGPAARDPVGCSLPLVTVHPPNSEKDHRNRHRIARHRHSPIAMPKPGLRYLPCMSR